jgi:hypothetical protein
MRKASFPLLILLLASAVVCAADLGHGVMVTLDRIGLTGGPYGLYSHGATTPTLFAGLIFAIIGIMAYVGDALVEAASVRVDWLADCAARIARIHVIPLAGIVFLVQIPLLYAMETFEQTLAFGHPLGLLTTFGGPLYIALVVHALSAFIMSSCAILFSRSITQAVRIVARAVAPYLRRPAKVTSLTAGARHTPVGLRAKRRRLMPLARHIANRPPPFASSLG